MQRKLKTFSNKAGLIYLVMLVISLACQTVWIQIRPDVYVGPGRGSTSLQRLSVGDILSPYAGKGVLRQECLVYDRTGKRMVLFEKFDG